MYGMQMLLVNALYIGITIYITYLYATWMFGKNLYDTEKIKNFEQGL